VLTSSTGSALLAAAGLLTGRTAATHWLAGPLLEWHGVQVSPERLVVDAPYVTCAGLASTYECAYVVARAIGGPLLEMSIREDLREATADRGANRSPGACPQRSRYRPRGGGDTAPEQPAPTFGHAPEIELEDTSGRRTARRRRRA
jgi:transcriptional regulator GlxA family with amidase domain